MKYSSVSRMNATLDASFTYLKNKEMSKVKSHVQFLYMASLIDTSEALLCLMLSYSLIIQKTCCLDGSCINDKVLRYARQEIYDVC